MSIHVFSPRSLRTKVTVFTLAIFVVSIWTLIAFANRILEGNIARLVGRQQAATVNFMAAEIDSQLRDRVAILEKIAGNLTPEHFRGSTVAQRYLADRLTMLSMFSGGAFIVDQAGIAIADMPVSAGRLGINYLDGEAAPVALREGRTTIGRPVLGRKLKTPVFSIAAPVRSPDGLVIGALVGVTDLSQPNFLDHLVGSRYGETGYYLLEEPTTRTVITGTDKARMLQPLPPLGQNALIDRHVEGSDETGVAVNPLGVEVMASAARIRSANWFLLAALPTEEAFAPIRELRRKLTVTAIGLTFLAGGLTWWMLQRQLSPLLSTARTLGSLATEPRALVPPLPITRRDEIGVLIVAFNRLLETLRLREEALQTSETRFRTLVEWSPTAVGVHRDGRLLYVNPAAVALFGAGSAAELVGTPGVDRVHPDYRQNSLARNQHLTSGARTVPVITQKFLKLDGTVFEAEVQSITINYDGAPAVYVAISDITARRQADDALHASLREKEALLKEVHHRVKNNLQVIMSLLRMEGRRSTQPATKSVLGEMQSRIRSMALLHESLYRSGTFAAVDLASYLTQLATQAFRSAQTSPHAVRLELALAPVLVEMDQALPCGLLVNELLSNALKHAFPAGRPGSVHISLQPLVAEPGRWCLAVADDGVGLPADLELRRHQSLGLQLAADLACQLHGTLAISSAAGATGTRLAVTFNIGDQPPSLPLRV